MAKNNRRNFQQTEAQINQSEATMSETETETAAPVAVTEAKVDERLKFVTDPDTGASTPRAAYIRKCWTEKKMTRGDIAKHLTELTGKKVIYQIVFAATKGVAGGPDKAPEAPTTAVTDAPATEAAVEEVE